MYLPRFVPRAGICGCILLIALARLAALAWRIGEAERQAHIVPSRRERPRATINSSSSNHSRSGATRAAAYYHARRGAQVTPGRARRATDAAQPWTRDRSSPSRSLPPA
eukprot:12742125-Alexandrium_andersonii.AAC.1